jgi:hypothetical protein
MQMKTNSFVTKLLLGLTALALAVGAPLSTNVDAQVTSGGVVVQPFRARFVSDIKTAVSTDVGIYVKYIGSAAGAATVAVDAATGDLTFIADGAADATLECPLSAPFAGVIDVSDAACNTVGEVVDIINMSANWVAVPHAMLRSDSSNNTLITLAATSAKGPGGLGLLKDSAVALNMGVVLFPTGTAGGPYTDLGADNGISNYLNSNGVVSNKLKPNPFNDRNTTLLYAHENITTTDNAANLFRVFCVVPNFNPAKSTTAAVVSAETVRELYQEAAALTTATGLIDEFRLAGGLTCNGGKLLVRVNGTTTLTAPTVFANGYVWYDRN